MPLSRRRFASARMSFVFRVKIARFGVGFALRRVESHAESAHVEGAPVFALLRDAQAQYIPIERDRALHVLHFVVDILDARDQVATLREDGKTRRDISITRNLRLLRTRPVRPRAPCSTTASQSSSGRPLPGPGKSPSP